MLAKRYNVVQMRQFFSSKSCVRLLSLPMRGEWIEISIFRTNLAARALSLPMRGEWIEINLQGYWGSVRVGLSPCGESGLKSMTRARERARTKSLPMRGEWIEIASQA